jgi:hypothetical protein
MTLYAAQVSAFGSDSESDHLDNWEVHLVGSGSVWLRDEKVNRGSNPLHALLLQLLDNLFASCQHVRPAEPCLHWTPRQQHASC